MTTLTRTGFLAGLFTGLFAGVFLGGLPVRAAEPPTVFAAASLKNALDDIAGRYAQEIKEAGKAAPRISYAASNTLAKQIEQGAPADLFFSA